MAMTRILAILLLSLLILASVWVLVRSFQPEIAVRKRVGMSGGLYAIQGKGYASDETVSLEIKNAPVVQPGGWQLGTIQAAKGTFAFQSETFHCLRVDNPELRGRYGQQRVIFVATGLSSGRAATAVDTAGGVLVCP